MCKESNMQEKPWYECVDRYHVCVGLSFWKKYDYSLCCWELYKKIGTILMRIYAHITFAFFFFFLHAKLKANIP